LGFALEEESTDSPHASAPNQYLAAELSPEPLNYELKLSMLVIPKRYVSLPVIELSHIGLLIV